MKLQKFQYTIRKFQEYKYLKRTSRLGTPLQQGACLGKLATQTMTIVHSLHVKIGNRSERS